MASSIAYNMPTVVTRAAALRHTRNSKPLFSSLSFKIFCSSTSSPPNQRKLILYSKPGCCLCDGLKEKLHAAFSLAESPVGVSLHDVNLEIRDISTNADWERAYQYEIPVLAKLRPDGSEERLPRFSPRVGVELIHKKLAEALDQ